MTNEEWKEQHDRICAATLRHKDIARRNGVQLILYGNKFTRFQFNSKENAKNAFRIMMLDFAESHLHTIDEEFITVERNEV